MKKQILVIEDSTELSNSLLEIFAVEGLEGISASNGVEGVQLAKSRHPDLILCDIMMPELDGYGVVEALRKEPETADIPIIFLTARQEKTDLERALLLGIVDYIVKPFDVSDMLATVFKYLLP
jgi:CheY-like chemotaxis protein